MDVNVEVDTSPSLVNLLVDSFLNGTPSIYDGMSYVCILFLFVVVLTMHLRQIRNARRLKALEDREKEKGLPAWKL